MVIHNFLLASVFLAMVIAPAIVTVFAESEDHE